MEEGWGDGDVVSPDFFPFFDIGDRYSPPKKRYDLDLFWGQVEEEEKKTFFCFDVSFRTQFLYVNEKISFSPLIYPSHVNLIFL